MPYAGAVMGTATAGVFAANGPNTLAPPSDSTVVVVSPAALYSSRGLAEARGTQAALDAETKKWKEGAESGKPYMLAAGE